MNTKLESFNLNNGRLYCFTDGFSESRNNEGKEIGIEGVKKLINENENKLSSKRAQNDHKLCEA